MRKLLFQTWSWLKSMLKAAASIAYGRSVSFRMRRTRWSANNLIAYQRVRLITGSARTGRMLAEEASR